MTQLAEQTDLASQFPDEMDLFGKFQASVCQIDGVTRCTAEAMDSGKGIEIVVYVHSSDGLRSPRPRVSAHIIEVHRRNSGARVNITIEEE